MRCWGCGIDKTSNHFQWQGEKQGFLRTCKACRREKENKKHRRYYRENKAKYNEKTRRYYIANKEKCVRWHKKWQKEHPERIRELWNRRYKNDNMCRLARNMSRGMRGSIKENKAGRSWELLIGFTLRQLKKHIEGQFVGGMSWDNYGKWHIDHKIPISFFQYKSFNDVEFKMCWRLENLQPLWASDNIRKGKKVRRVA